MAELKPNPDGPDVFQLKRGLLADEFSLVPRLVGVRGVKICPDQLLLKELVRLLLRTEARRDATKRGRSTTFGLYGVPWALR